MPLHLFILLLLLRGVIATPGYVAVITGTFPTTRQASVTINGAHVEVLLQNSTIVAFRVPDKFLADPTLLATAVVKIQVTKTMKLPLLFLKSVFRNVDIDEFREKLLDEQRDLKRRKRSRRLVAAHVDDAEDSGQKVGEESGEESGAESGEESREKTVRHDQDDELLHHLDHQLDEHIDDVIPESVEVRTDTESEQNRQTDIAEDDGVRGLDGEQEFLQSDEWNEKIADIENQLEQSSVPKSTIQLLESAIESGSSRAEVSLASLLISGRQGLRRNHSRAVGLLRSAAGKGHPDAQALLGFFHASGIMPDVSRDIGAAVLMWTFAAEGGSLFAKMALGYRYFTGTDVAENCDKAAKYYKQVADQVFNDARVDLAGRRRDERDANADPMADIRPPMPSALLNADWKRLTEDMSKRVLGEANELIQFYRHSADRGDVESQVVLGQLYYYGAYQMPQDVPRARKLFEAAAAKGRGEAYAHLGFMDLQAGRNESAARFLKRAADRGDKLGLHGMGYITLHGIGVESDAARAVEYFLKAAEKEHPEAMYNLAIMYSRGIGGPKLLEESHDFFAAAARKYGHMQSNYNLGIRTLRGIPPAEKDCTSAVKYLKTVSQRGIWDKILSKAFRAYERDAYADALYRYLQAAHAGIELAQYNAAFMYEKKLLSNPDGFTTAPASGGSPSRAVIVEEALQLYAMSASQNSGDSMVRMGDLAFGEAKDYGRAAAAYERATKLRNAEAMFNLGWMHARGFGMNPDRHMAKRYFDQARETDDNAKIPAAIAVYSLQYSEKFFELLDKASILMERCRRVTDISSLGEQGGDAVLGSFAVVDAVVLTILLSFLVIVVNTRQRRMVQANGEMPEERADGINVGRRVENNATLARDNQERNGQNQEQNGNRQVQEEER